MAAMDFLEGGILSVTALLRQRLSVLEKMFKTAPGGQAFVIHPGRAEIARRQAPA
jgi:hypothetical protein